MENQMADSLIMEHVQESMEAFHNLDFEMHNYCRPLGTAGTDKEERMCITENQMNDSLTEHVQEGMEIFHNLESEVRNYCRSLPTVFEKALGYHLVDENGNTYIDFFSGAGVLNYGHNNPDIKRKLMSYLEGNGITHSLDMSTTAKKNFLNRFNEIILKPRGLDYKIQFTGPTGCNAIEAALKLARKNTGRQTVVSFTNGFHGMTLGALSVTYNPFKRAGAGMPLDNSVFMPYDGFSGADHDTIDYLETFFKTSAGCSNLPAAVILETIQCEGGINVARIEWLQRLEALVKKYEILLIVDDIQVGCGRTGTFFSFESAGIKPDLICLSKSLSGFGLPLSIVLIKPDLDIWKRGEHCGTFRGHNLAFITASESLTYWETDDLSKSVLDKSELIHQRLKRIAEQHSGAGWDVRGRGFIWGLDFGATGLGSQVCAEAFKRGLIIETSGKDNVLKLIPPLIIDTQGLNSGIDIIEQCVDIVFSK